MQPHKLGTCRVCGEEWIYDETAPTYSSMQHHAEFTCARCNGPETKTTVCIDCQQRKPNAEILLCDGNACDAIGATCLMCAELTSVPKEPWFCSVACEKSRKVKRARKDGKKDKTGPVCSYTVLQCEALQFWAHCETCDADACLGCLTVCHAGHKTGEIVHGIAVCSCGKTGMCCNRFVIRSSSGGDISYPVRPQIAVLAPGDNKKLAHFDAMLETRNQAANLARTRDQLIQQLEVWRANIADTAARIKLTNEALATAVAQLEKDTARVGDLKQEHWRESNIHVVCGADAAVETEERLSRILHELIDTRKQIAAYQSRIATLRQTLEVDGAQFAAQKEHQLQLEQETAEWNAKLKEVKARAKKLIAFEGF